MVKAKCALAGHVGLGLYEQGPLALERRPQGELDLAGTVSLVINYPEQRPSKRSVGRPELDSIEKVEEFRPEIETAPFG